MVKWSVTHTCGYHEIDLRTSEIQQLLRIQREKNLPSVGGQVCFTLMISEVTSFDTFTLDYLNLMICCKSMILMQILPCY